MFKLGLAQCKHPEVETEDSIVELVSNWAEKAKEVGVDILVFPEGLMGKYDKQTNSFPLAPQSIDGTFCKRIDTVAKENNIWLVYTFNEANDGNKPFNTAVITNNEGEQVGSYRKVHLFDTDFTKESDRISAGNKLFEPIDTPFGKLGLCICYDVRFPEVARAAAIAGCQLFITTAAWVEGNLKAMQWETMLRARAIENQMFVAGVSRCDDKCIGDSCIFGPCGMLKAQGDDDEALIMADIDTSKIEMIQSQMPLLTHRRPDVY